MNCLEFENLLDSGAIKSGRLPVEAAEHLKSCPACKEVFNDAEFAGKVFKAANCRLDDDLRVSIMDSIMKIPLPSKGNVLPMTKAAGSGPAVADARTFLRSRAFMAVAAMAACVAALILYPGPQGLIGTPASEPGWVIAEVSGNVTTLSGVSTAAAPLRSGPLTQGVRLACVADGAMRIVLPGRAVLELRGPFELTPGTGSVTLDSGTVSCKITPGTGGFSVLSDPWAVRVLGTSFEVTASQHPKIVKVLVTTGKVRIEGEKLSATVEKGEWVSAGPGGISRGLVACGEPPCQNIDSAGSSGPVFGGQKAGAAPAIPDSVRLMTPGLDEAKGSSAVKSNAGITAEAAGKDTGAVKNGVTSSGPGSLFETK